MSVREIQAKVLMGSSRSSSPPGAELPDEYAFRYVQGVRSAPADRTPCELLNVSFAGQPQSTDSTPDGLARDITGPYGLPDGTLLLWGQGQAVGTVIVKRDNETPGAASIDCVAVHPAHRGRGLGRLLIRQALGVARRHGLQPVYLASTNPIAIRLYMSEGFQKKTVMVCYRWQAGDAS